MKKIMIAIAHHVTDVVLVCGAVAVAAGVGMIYLPAGLIAGGVLAIAGAVLASMGSGDPS